VTVSSVVLTMSVRDVKKESEAQQRHHSKHRLPYYIAQYDNQSMELYNCSYTPFLSLQFFLQDSLMSLVILS
jgi:hypothetical protein